MKVIVAGGTGWIGGACVQRLLDVEEVTEVVAISRRELEVSNPKLRTVIIKDFLKYSDEEIEHLQGAQACIWALGKPMSGREVHIGYTQAVIKTLSEKVIPSLPAGTEFRFIYTSGGLVEADLSKTLWIGSGPRKMRGALQNEAVEYKQPAGGAGGTYKGFAVRPQMVTDGPPIWRVFAPSLWIDKKELAATMVSLAVEGDAQKQVWDNAEMRERGQAALAKTVKA